MGLLSGVGKLFRGVAGDLFGADDAAKAALEASKIDQAAYGSAINEVRQDYAPFKPIREQSATGFGQLLETGQSPLLAQIQEALGRGGEEAITRALSSQGRSNTGALPRAMADMSGQNYLSALNSTQNLYNAGLGLPTGGSLIAELLLGKGKAKSGGVLGAEQAYQNATGQLFNLATSALGAYAGGGGFGGAGGAGAM